MMIGLRGGATLIKSSMRRLNTKSSTEAGLVALTDCPSPTILTRDYLIGQVHEKVGPETVYKDHQNAIALVERGFGASEKTPHISISDIFSLKIELILVRAEHPVHAH